MGHILRGIAFTLTSAIGFCGPVAPAHLDRMVRDAKLIVVARVAQGSQSGPLVSVTLEVQRTLKGDAPSSMVSVSIAVSDEFSATRSLKDLQGMWFFSGDAAGNNTLLPAMYGSVPLEFSILPALPRLPPSWAGLDTASPTERVLRELSAALETNPAWPLLAEFVSQSSTEPASTLRSVYRRMQASSSQVVSAAGLAGLLRSGDVQGLEGLTAQLSRGPLPGRRTLDGASRLSVLEWEPSRASSPGRVGRGRIAGTAPARLRGLRTPEHPLQGVDSILDRTAGQRRPQRALRRNSRLGILRKLGLVSE